MGKRGVHTERHAVQRHMRKQIEEAIEDSVLSPTPARLSFKDMQLLREREFRVLERRHAAMEDDKAPMPLYRRPEPLPPHPTDGGSAQAFIVVASCQAPDPVKTRGAGSTKEPRHILSPASKSRFKWEPPKPRFNPRKGY